MEKEECTVVITDKLYKELMRDRQFLRALEGAGVDNWQGYDYAMDALREQGFFKEDEE